MKANVSGALRALITLAFLVLLGGLTAAQLHGQASLPDGLYARISTPRGAIILRLYYDKAPITVGNFVGLAEGSLAAAKGKPFYDGLTFHRVVADFVIQGGDPLGNGRGGPGYAFPDEFAPGLRHDAAGVLSMANSGPGTNGSQFFITLGPAAWLDGKHSVFGMVYEGLDVVRKIAQGDKMERVEIIRVGEAAKAFKTDQAAFDARLALRLAADKAAVVADFRKKWPDLVLGSDGIWAKVLVPGAGTRPPAGATVSVNYTGMFIDGKIFDQSAARGQPFEFQVGKDQVIKGWDATLLQMKKGEKRLVVLPPELAYGPNGAGGVIPPNAFLAFEIELLDIK